MLVIKYLRTESDFTHRHLATLSGLTTSEISLIESRRLKASPGQLERLARALRVSRPSVHCFRHTYAVHATKNGLDVFRLSRILGHSSINTTQIYLRSIGFEHLQQGAKYSPLRGGA